jgi:hypothetical protein
LRRLDGESERVAVSRRWRKRRQVVVLGHLTALGWLLGHLTALGWLLGHLTALGWLLGHLTALGWLLGHLTALGVVIHHQLGRKLPDRFDLVGRHPDIHLPQSVGLLSETMGVNTI